MSVKGLSGTYFPLLVLCLYFLTAALPGFYDFCTLLPDGKPMPTIWGNDDTMKLAIH